MDPGSMKRSIDRVHRGGPWTRGLCFVYVLKLDLLDFSLVRTDEFFT